MTQEDKELLLTDICARLPYETMVECSIESGESMDVVLQSSHIAEFIEGSITIKPYLRPMSSMTKEESKKLWELLKKLGMTTDVKRLDWLTSHHFDIRGLIEKGLALKAPEDMYKTK